MALRSAPVLLLVWVAVALRESCFGAFSHSLKILSTAISESSQRQPHFVGVGYVDDLLFSYYNSNNRKVQPRVPWMEKVEKDDPHYWERETQIVRGQEEVTVVDLRTLRIRYNQSEGLHTWQLMYGCELRRDGKNGGFEQHGYDGRTFLTFDKETLTWVAPEPQAQITKRKWDALPGNNQRYKIYLEEICIKWLEKYLSYGKETLLRTGEHLNGDWTFLLYGRISRTHSAPLSPWSATCYPTPFQPLSRTREALIGSHSQAAIQWTRKCSLCLAGVWVGQAGKALEGVLFTAHKEGTIWGYSMKPPLAKL